MSTFDRNPEVICLEDDIDDNETKCNGRIATLAHNESSDEILSVDNNDTE